MTIRTILVPFGANEHSVALLETARAAAGPFAAHLDVIHIRPHARDAVPTMTNVVPSHLIHLVLDAAEENIGRRAAAARELFDTFCAEHAIAVVEGRLPSGAVTAAWREETGLHADLLARHGRLADLLVVPRPVPDTPSHETVETALMETGRPVIVAPPASPETLGRRIAIGWNGSTVAVRAVAAAMPFLAVAEAVTVLTTEHGAEPHTDPEDLAEHLALHDIAASAHSFRARSRGVGEALLGEARRLGADLLVVGAYGHGHVRELVLGGVTRDVLAAADLPVFVTH